MTQLALSFWIWEQTQAVTPLALIGLFTQLPQIPLTLLSGVIVDRLDRRVLMIVADSVAALSTLMIVLLFQTGTLQIWHLYIFVAVNGIFGQLQQLAYSTCLSLLLPAHQYSRANSLNIGIHYGAIIFAPAAAGLLYPLIGLVGIGVLDLVSFCVAISTLLMVVLPQPSTPEESQPPFKLNVLFGFNYIWHNPDLRWVLLISGLFWFFHDLGDAVYEPMILSRTNGDVQIFGSIVAAAGIGGVLGTLLLSVWGGPKRDIKGMIWGYVGAGLSKICFGLGRSPRIWIPAQLSSSLHFPLLGSSEKTVWMTQTQSAVQGRVFAVNSLVQLGGGALAALIAGPLADNIFAPLLLEKTFWSTLIGTGLGSGAGAGIALLYIMTAAAMTIVGLVGFTLI